VPGGRVPRRLQERRLPGVRPRLRGARLPLHARKRKANQTRLKTASELKRREWGTEGFGSSLLRHCLFAVYQSADKDRAKVGLNYLKTELRDYWAQRENLAELLRFIGRLPIAHWSTDAEAARLLAGALENDHV